MDLEKHHNFMLKALSVAENCRDIEWYGVGCVIIGPNDEVLSTGYTGELQESDGKYRHAEDIAIEKALSNNVDLNNVTLYSTLEPCSIRASAKTPCVRHIIQNGIKKVVIGAKEPYEPALGIVCNGTNELSESGVEVIFLSDFEDRCLKSARSKRCCSAP